MQELKSVKRNTIISRFAAITLSNFWKLENEVKKVNESTCIISKVCYNRKVSFKNGIFI